MGQTITVTFAPGQTEAIAAEPLEQWAYGQKLLFSGLELPTAYQVDFSNWEFCGDSIARIGDSSGVAVPAEVLATGANVYAFVWIQTENAGRRRYRAAIRVVPGPLPNPETPNPEEESTIAEAIGALNDGVAAAESAADSAAESAAAANSGERNAEAWAVGARNGVPVVFGDPTYHNNAKFYAEAAAQGAEDAGYAWFDINDADGKMYVTISDNLSEDVSFLIDENTGNLEVTVQ